MVLYLSEDMGTDAWIVFSLIVHVFRAIKYAINFNSIPNIEYGLPTNDYIS